MCVFGRVNLWKKGRRSACCRTLAAMIREWDNAAMLRRVMARISDRLASLGDDQLDPEGI